MRYWSMFRLTILHLPLVGSLLWCVKLLFYRCTTLFISAFVSRYSSGTLCSVPLYWMKQCTLSIWGRRVLSSSSDITRTLNYAENFTLSNLFEKQLVARLLFILQTPARDKHLYVGANVALVQGNRGLITTWWQGVLDIRWNTGLESVSFVC